MKIFELRVYTLCSGEALDFYKDNIYPRHLRSFPLFGIEAHGFWTAPEDIQPRLYVLVSFPSGQDPKEISNRYMKSKEFLDDIRGFDVADIVGVQSTILKPSTSSPLA